MRKKISNVVSAILMVLLISTAAFSALQVGIPKAHALEKACFTNPLDPPSHTVVVTPGSTVLPNLTSTVTYNVTVTSTATSYINVTDILLPTGWVNSTGVTVPNSYWNITGSGSGWLNFTDTNTTDISFCNGTALSFIIPVTISIVSANPATGTWNVYCYEGTIASSPQPVSYSTSVSLEFASTMVPLYVTNATYNFIITTTNLYSGLAISKINITFPLSGWTYVTYNSISPNYWSEAYSIPTSTFVLTGSPISNTTAPTSVSLNVTMTVSFTVPTYGINYWNVTCVDSSGANLGVFSVPAVVDNSPPAVAFTLPSYYTVGFGGYIWLNATVTDYLSILAYPITVTVNDSRFVASVSAQWTSIYVFNYTFVNTTAIPNGPVALKISAVDLEGNVGTATATTTIQTTAPILTSISVRDAITNTTLYQDASGNFWMKATTTSVEVNATFFTAATWSGSIYMNGTFFATFTISSNDTWSGSYTVALSTILITLNITLTDNSLPSPNHYTNVWNVERELTYPSAVSYTTPVTTIAGGAIIRGITASDPVGIQLYNVYLNGTVYSLSLSQLGASALYNASAPVYSFAGTVVLDLFDLPFGPGTVANITLVAVNYGSNPGPAVSIFITVPTGQWYPVQLYAGWNLISWPLIPVNTSTANIYSLILKAGPSDVIVTYGYNETTDLWMYNPAQLADGFGQWVDVSAYDVLIVQGTVNPAPPALPTSYLWTQGWVLAGYKSVQTRTVLNYIASLQTTPMSYFIYFYAWNATSQSWNMLTTSSMLSPGQGFWIYLYSNQYEIPPIP